MADTSRSGGRPDNANRTKLIVGAVIVVLILWFALANRDSQEVHILFWSVNMRMIYVILVSAILGAIADRLFLHRRRDR